MTWLTIAVLTVIVFWLLRHEVTDVDNTRLSERDTLLAPGMQGGSVAVPASRSLSRRVNAYTRRGTLVIVSPQGVLLPVDGDVWTLDDTLDVLADVETL